MDFAGRLLRDGMPIGTAFVVHRNGLIVTCYHVLVDAGVSAVDDTLLFEPFKQGEPFEARVTSRVDVERDLALLLAVGPLPRGQVVAQLSPSAVPQGSKFITTGFGVWEDPGYTFEFSPAIGDVVGIARRNGVDTLLLESSHVMLGMSGCPVVTTAGAAVIGMVTGRYHAASNGFGTRTVWAARSEDIAELHEDLLLRTADSVTNDEQSSGQLEALKDYLTRDVRHRLPEMRRRSREGETDAISSWLESLKADDVWKLFDVDLQASVLRFEAGTLLDTNGEAARDLANLAESLSSSPDEDRFLRAQLQYRESGPVSALDALGDATGLNCSNLRGLLHLSKADLPAARLALRVESLGFVPDAETLRVRALLHLLEGDLPQAHLQIAKALDLETNAKYLRFTAGLVKYFYGLSPAARPRHLVDWPNPTEADLTKQDDYSVQMRREAAKLFRETLATATEREKPIFEVWLIACLASNPESRSEAEEYCRGLIAARPDHYRAVVWALHFGFRAELEPCLAALDERRNSGIAELEVIDVLLLCSLELGKLELTERVLRDSRTQFVKQESGDRWTQWTVRSLIASGFAWKALQVLNRATTTPALRIARIEALFAIADTTRDLGPLVAVMEDNFSATHDASYLLQLCKLYGRLGLWPKVAERSNDLVQQIGTWGALYFAASALFYIHAYDACLRLLDANRSLAPSQLPQEYRRLRTECLRRIGIYQEAVTEAAAMVQEAPTLDNLGVLANLSYLTGNYSLFVSTAEELVGHPDVSVNTLLALAKYLRHYDEDLASRALHSALAKGLSEDLVAPAFAIANELGIQDYEQELIERLGHLARVGRGGVQALSLEEVVRQMQDQHAQATDVWQKYNAGTVPIHFVSQALGLPLVALYHSNLSQYESNKALTNRFMVFARHGSRRSIADLSASSKWRLNLDITAVLLAQHLDILGLVSSTYRPLRIAGDLIPALLEMADQLGTPQPVRIKSQELVIDLVSAGSIRIVDEQPILDPISRRVSEIEGKEFGVLLHNAKNAGGVLVVPRLSRWKEAPEGPAVEIGEVELIGPSALVTSLPLAPDDREKALESVGGAYDSSEVSPSSGMSLYLTATIAEGLAGAGVLRVAAAHFRLHIGTSELERLRASIRADASRQVDRHWISLLIQRVRRGVDEGDFEIIPSPATALVQRQDVGPTSKSVRTVLTLLDMDAQPTDVIWVDDRMISGFGHRSGTPIIGVCDVLDGLQEAGVLALTDKYHLLHRLREGNVGFLMVAATEMVHHLSNAPQVGHTDAIAETPQLTAIRRYFAYCHLNATFLQRPAQLHPDSQMNGELGFALRLNREVDEALLELWRSEEDYARRKACSDWLIDCVYVNVQGLRNLTGLQSEHQNDRSLVAASAALLLSKGIELESESRREYFDWLVEKKLGKQLAAIPHLSTAIAEILKPTFLDFEGGTTEGTEDDVQSAVVRFVLQSFYMDLPKEITDALDDDPELRERLGFKRKQVVTLGSMEFDAQEFWNAASEALNGRQATVQIEGNGEALFHRFDNDHPLPLAVTSTRAGENTLLEELELAILVDSVADRETVLRGHPEWFDDHPNQAEEMVAEIASTASPAERMSKLTAQMERSAAVYYKRLRDQIRSQGTFRLNDLLPPPVDVLARHYRLNLDVGAGEELTNSLDVAASILLDQVGLEQTILRLARLPIALSKAVIDRTAQLSAAARADLFDGLSQAASSPIGKLHFARLVGDYLGESRKFRLLATRSLGASLTERGREEFEAMQSLVDWVHSELSNAPESQGVPDHLVLAMAWAHSLRLYEILGSGDNSKWIQDTFQTANRHLPLHQLRRSTMWFDVSQPRQLRWATATLCGLGYAGSSITDAALDSKLSWFFDVESNPAGVFLLRRLDGLANSIESIFGSTYKSAALNRVSRMRKDVPPEPPLEEAIEEVLGLFATDHVAEEKGWLRIQLLVGDGPLPDAMQQEVSVQVSKTDFESMGSVDLLLCLRILVIVTGLSPYLDLDAREYLERQIVAVAKIASELESGALTEDDLNSVQTSILESSIRTGTGYQESWAMAVSRLWRQLVVAWPSLADYMIEAVHRLCDELPPSDAKYFWPVLVQIRAR